MERMQDFGLFHKQKQVYVKKTKIYSQSISEEGEQKYMI